MAIVKMKRLRLIGMRSDRGRLLRLLQKLGCVEIAEPAIDLTDPNWAALAKPDGRGLAIAKEQNTLLNNALTALSAYDTAKGGLFAARPEVSEGELFDETVYETGLKTASAILDAEREVAALVAEQSKLRAQKVALAPWIPLDVPLEMEGSKNVSLVFGTVPARVEYAAVEAAVAGASELSCMFYSSADRDLQYFLLLCHVAVEDDCVGAMREFGFSRANLRSWTGTAVDNDRMLDNQLAVIEEKIVRAKENIASYVPERNALRLCVDRSVQEISREEAEGHLVDTADAFYLDGWMPAESEDKLAQVLSGFMCAWEASDPTPEEYPDVPVKLRNNRLTKPLNMITEMYVPPAYDGIDPNPLMAPFFVIYFGMMMGDFGYGLVMLVLGWLLLKKMRAKGTMEYMGGLLILCGISSAVFGALTGSFFGDFIPQLLRLINPESTFELPYLFTPLNDTLMILIASLVMGFIQVITGMIVSVVYKVKTGDWIDALFSEISWFIIMIGGAMALFGIGSVGGVPVVLVIGALMLAIGGTRNAKGFGKVTSLVGIVYNGISGYFSDILSYARLMALMLAGAVIAQVFNTLGAVTGSVIGFIVVSLIGNTLNLALNLLGCYVHDLRLQCLEFFGRFYKEGRQFFKPLSMQTKYVDIVKEDN